jgi:hypothetical protein
MSSELVVCKLLWSIRQVPGLAVRLKNRKRVREADPSSGDDEAINIILAQRAARRKKEQERELEQESEHIDDSMDVCSSFPFFSILTCLAAR